MKKLLLIGFLFLSILSFAQDGRPSGLLTIQSPGFYYYQTDSSVWLYKGLTYTWTKLASKRMLNHSIDSLSALGYKKVEVDNLLSGKVDKVTGKSLVLDTEIAKIHALHADDQDLTPYRIKTDHDSLSTLEEKSYNSLTDKPVLGASAFHPDSYFQTAITGLTNNYLPKWNGSSFENSLIYDNGANVGILTATTGTIATLLTVGSADYGNSAAGARIRLGTQYGDGSSYITSQNSSGNQSTLQLQTQSSSSGVLNAGIFINGTGNVGINYISGTEITNNKLAVNGAGYFNGNLTTPSINLSTGAAVNKIWQCTNATTGAGQWSSVATTQTFVSTWDASTNTPTLADGTGTNGYYHRVVVAGTRNLGSGNIIFEVGDNIIYNSSGIWQRDPKPTIVGNALTKTDDTNVTLTLGGSPSTSLLNATSLTLGWTGTLADNRITGASNWNTAYTDRLKWDGGLTGLTASTGRASLGLVIGTDVLAYRTFGTMANSNIGDYLPLIAGSGNPLTGTLYGASANFSGTIGLGALQQITWGGGYSSGKPLIEGATAGINIYPKGNLSDGVVNIIGSVAVIGGNSGQWNTAYGWGNHAGLYAPISTVSNATHTGDATGSTVLTLATVNAAVGTYNNVTVNAKGLVTGASNAGYLTSFTEADPFFTAWNKSTGISITKSQVSDFGSYQPLENQRLSTTNSPTFSSLYLSMPQSIYWGGGWASGQPQIEGTAAGFNIYPKGNLTGGVVNIAGSVTVTGGGSTNWNTAYGWGDWRHTTLAGYGITDALVLGSTSTTAAAGDHTHADLSTLMGQAYTPTLTNTQNISYSAIYSALFTRVKNVIHVKVGGVITTSATGSTKLTITLPYTSSAYSAGTYVLGSGIYIQIANAIPGLVYLSTSSTIQFSLTSPAAASGDFSIELDYLLN